MSSRMHGARSRELAFEFGIAVLFDVVGWFMSGSCACNSSGRPANFVPTGATSVPASTTSGARTFLTASILSCITGGTVMLTLPTHSGGSPVSIKRRGASKCHESHAGSAVKTTVPLSGSHVSSIVVVGVSLESLTIYDTTTTTMPAVGSLITIITVTPIVCRNNTFDHVAGPASASMSPLSSLSITALVAAPR